MEKKNYLTIGEASEYLGVSIDTLRRWEKRGRITPYRSPGGHRYYEKEELDNLFGKRYTRDLPTAQHTVSPPELSPDVTNPISPIVSTPDLTTSFSSDDEDNIFGTRATPTSPISHTSPPVPPHTTPTTYVEKSHIPREIKIRSIEPVRVTRHVVAAARVEVVELPEEPQKPVIIESIATVTESEISPETLVHSQPLLNPKPEVLTPQGQAPLTPQDTLIPQVSFKADAHPQPGRASAKPAKTKAEKKEMATTVIVLAILLLVIILGVILFLMLWSSSRSVLSPTP